MKIISTLLIIAIPVFCFSQSEFKAGFIVKNSGDTLRGFLKKDFETNLQLSVRFTHNNSTAEIEKYTINDISSFGFDNGNIFQKVSYTNPSTQAWTEHFAKLMLDGYYQLFSFSRDDRPYYVIKVRKDSSYLLYDVNYTSTGVIKEEGNYKNVLLFLSRNCPEIKGKLDYLSFNDIYIINYLQILNKCVDPSSTSNVVYRKEKSKLNVFVYAGGMAFSNKHEITAKAIARLIIPGLDGKTSINTGINYMQNFERSYVEVYYMGNKTKQEITINMFSIPVSIQHNFTKGIIQPYLDAGMSLVYKKGTGAIDYGARPVEDHNKKGIGFTAAIGLDGYITKNLSIKAEWRYELVLHLPTIGVAYTFK